jgi:hypothetical protein
MVPKKCDGPCQRNLMIWDVRKLEFKSPGSFKNGKITLGPVYSGYYCEQCVPPNLMTKAEPLIGKYAVEDAKWDLEYAERKYKEALDEITESTHMMLARQGGAILPVVTEKKPMLAEHRAAHRFPKHSTKEFDPGFHGPEEGSEDRFIVRKTKVPWFKHTTWWLVHNCLSHPVIGLIPIKMFFKFHDWTSRKMHGK